MKGKLHAGIDVGSTTAKVVVLDDGGEVVYSDYRRHNAQVAVTLGRMLDDASDSVEGEVRVVITGSAGMGIAERVKIPFIQEVVASAEAVRRLYPGVRTLIDVGGEDTKMVFFDNRMRPDMRMNGNCAGGTGAFIDQMATLLGVDISDLNDMAERAKTVHPIASRCGVFAKTDVQNLLSRDIPNDDVAASIFKAVAIQTVSALARGKEPEAKVLFCGGPLTFMPKLGDFFLEVLGMEREDVTTAKHGEMLPAIGAALADDLEKPEFTLEKLADIMKRNVLAGAGIRSTLEPLFLSDAERDRWMEERFVRVGREVDLEDVAGEPLFLGIDSGSTTTKVVLIDKTGNIIFSHYASNGGNPIRAAVKGLERLKGKAGGSEVRIAGTAVTGYGEDLIRAAFGMDSGQVETIAHYRAAMELIGDVTFILDIGGQDMKAIFIEDGIIGNIEINEACSSGCGSFIETFANSLGMGVEDFAAAALRSDNPADLGTRCTVFMNSKVKQSLREGASVEDIAAGLSYSVIKNCLHKVLKIKDRNVLGDRVVVQGGTFKNPSVQRAFENILGMKVVCPHIPELMGAYGAALLARDSAGEKSSFIGLDGLDAATDYVAKHIRCRGCQNNCTVTKMTFSNGRIFHSGNKCERIFSNQGEAVKKGFNMPDYKLDLLFDRPTKPNTAPVARIGIPRVLNIYENYPFWNALLVESGFEVVLSPESTAKVYEAGAKTVMSDNICYPAKMTHGHVVALADMGVDRLFFPTVVREADEFEKSLNSFNCPVVTGYPDVIRSALAVEESMGIPFDVPVVSFDDWKLLKNTCWKYLKGLGVPRSRFERAFKKAREAQQTYRSEVLEMGRRVLEDAAEKGEPVILLLGRPYHVDRQINHKIPEMAANMGAHVLTEDSIPGGDIDMSDVHVLTQWAYANRIFAAAKVAKSYPNVHVIQLNSFGCGPDAIAVDEAKEILASLGKSHTLLKIDDVSSPGSNRLRIRSMMESVKLRGGEGRKRKRRCTTPPFEMKDRGRVLLAPFFSHFHSPLIEAFSREMGYDMVTLPPPDRESVEVGLKYTNNEICYPAIIVIGDLIKALQSGKYDRSNVAVGITQTGGQCRASSYLSLLKKGLVSAGFGDVPVVTVSLTSDELNHQPGFKTDLKLFARKGLYGLLYADAIMQFYYATAPRELNRGDARRVADRYMGMSRELVRGPARGFLRAVSSAAREFNAIPVKEENIPVVGFVGEIYVKYNSFGNLHMVDWLTDNGVEVVVPPMFDFFAQILVNTRVDVRDHQKRRGLGWVMTYPADWFIKKQLARFEEAKRRFRFYRPTHDYTRVAARAEEVVHLTNQFGEGWLIPGEVAAMAEEGINNVLCVQPFGCIANHIIGKGVEKRLKELYPDLNLLNLDLDAGSSEVNVYNRLGFLVKSARDEARG